MEKEEKPAVRQLIRILGTDLPGNYTLARGLTHIKGIGPSLSHALCVRFQLEERKLLSSLTDVDIKGLETQLRGMKGMEPWLLNRQRDFDTGNDMHVLTTDIKFRRDFDIKRMQKIRSYRGMRHAAGQPVRGQRTKAHFRKGRSMGVQKKSPTPAVGKS